MNKTLAITLIVVVVVAVGSFITYLIKVPDNVFMRGALCKCPDGSTGFQTSNGNCRCTQTKSARCYCNGVDHGVISVERCAKACEGTL